VTKRILQIIPTFDRGGAEKQLTLLAAGLPRDEFEVHVCALTRGGPLQEDLDAANIPVTVIGKSWKVDPLAYYRLRKHIHRLAPDLVHTWIFAANAYGRHAAAGVGIKHLVAGERCVDPWKSGYQFAIDRHLARRTDRIATNSTGVREFYVEHGLPEEKFTIIPNGIAPFENPSPCSRAELLAELALPEDARLIGAVGRLWPQKRLKDLIWSTDLLKCVRDDAHLLIIGDGPQRWRLERYRDQVDLRGRVHFLGNRSDVSRFLPHLDCFWLGSGYEGQSNAIMEAMSAAVPVIASDIAGNRDLVIPAETGHLFPLGDRAALARLTNVLLDDPARSRQLGEAGRQRMLDEFSIAKMIDRHAIMYRELLNG